MKIYILLLLSLIIVWPSVSVGQSTDAMDTTSQSSSEFLHPEDTLVFPDGFAEAMELAGLTFDVGFADASTIFSDDNDRWITDTNLSNVGIGVVYSIAVSGNDVFVGGTFTTVGGVDASRIARYNMTTDTWHTLGDGLNHTVRSLLISGSDLYVGGEFATAGGLSAIGIARYDITTDTWHAMGSGVGGSVLALAAFGNDLFLGGTFTTAGGQSAIGIARYDMTTGFWYALGEGVSSVVNSLGISGNDLYVGGTFSHAGGQLVYNIARYDMTENTWHALGSGVGGQVLDLAASEDNVFVTGVFVTAGGVSAFILARYEIETGTWHGLTSNWNNFPQDLVIVGNDLYVGGQFTIAGVNANRIVRYDILNDSWHALGSGVNGTVWALAASGNDLFVGGAFSQAGGKGALNLARWTGIMTEPGDVLLVSPADEAEDVSVTPTFSWSAAERAETYELQVSTKSTFGTTVIDVAELTDLDVTDLNDPSYTVSTALDNATEYFWRVRAVNAGGDGDWSETRSFTTIVAVPDQVALTSPDDEAEDVSVTPTFSWSAAERAETYELQVSTESTFGSTVIDVAELTDLDQSIRSTLDNATEYFWRVRAVNAGGAGDWSETRSFTTIVNLPDVITLTSPSHESTGLSIHPSFSWEPDPLATTYTLQITTDLNFGTGVQTYTDIEELFFNLPVDLQYSTTYYWRVAGVNTTGVGAYVDANRFTTLDLPVPIQPTVFYPVNDAQDVPLLFTFIWEDLGEGHLYDFELAQTDQYSEPIIALAGTTLTTFTPDVALDPQTQYFWRIRAINEYGPGEWNDFFGFTTLIPSNPGQVRDLTVEEIVTVSKVSAIQTTQNTASFLLTWSPPESDGGSPITNYNVVYREQSDTEWTTYNRDPSTDTTAIVTGFTPGVAYAFDVLAENSIGASEPNEDAPIVVSIETEELPTQVTLNQNYPNPFNPSTTIRFALPTSGKVRLEVYSILGQRMAVLVSGQQPAGWHTVTLNASTWSSGTYIYRLQADGMTMTRKFLLLK